MKPAINGILTIVIIAMVWHGYVFGKNCAGVFFPVGFSSSGQVVVTAGPYFEVGEDKPEEDSCVQQKGFWLMDTDTLIPAVSQLPDNYRVERYGKVAP